MQSPTHIECSSDFPFQENWSGSFSSSHSKSQQFFPWSISLVTAAFSLVSLGNVFSWSLQVWTQTLLHGNFCWTCFVHIYRPRIAWPSSHKANEFSYATFCAACKNHVTLYKTSQAFIACHNLAFKLPQNVRMHLERMSPATCSQVRIHMYTNFLPKFWWILKMTPGTIKKPEFWQKPEDSHPWWPGIKNCITLHESKLLLQFNISD